MILQALVRCYDALAEAGRLEKPGWSPVKVSLALELDENGALLVRRADGDVSAVQAGEVSVRGLYGYTT